jgi:hypothetical protein
MATSNPSTTAGDRPDAPGPVPAGSSPAPSEAPPAPRASTADRGAPASGSSAATGTGAVTGAVGERGPDLARKTLGAIRRQSNVDPPASAAASTGLLVQPARPQVSPEPAPDAVSPSRDELVEAWGDQLLFRLSNKARARFRVGRFLAVEGGAAVFALPNDTHRSYCEEVRSEVEEVLGQHFGRAVPVRLVVDDESELNAAPRRGGTTTGSAGAGRAPAPDSEHAALLDPVVLATETEPAGAGPSPEQRVKQLFPGAEEV